MKYLKDKQFKGNLLLATYVVVLAYVFLNLKTVGGFIGGVTDIIKPFLIAICIAFVLNLPMKFFENKVLGLILKKNSTKKDNGLRRALAIILTLITIIGLFIGLVLFVIPQLVESGSTLVKNIPGYLESLEGLMAEYMGSTEVFNEIWEQIVAMWQDILQVIGQITGAVLSQVLDITMGVTSTIFNFVMGILIAIYILLSKEKLALQAKKIIYAFVEEGRAEKVMRVAKISNFKFSKFVAGQCMEAMILGSLCFIGMSIFRMPYALLISTIIGITALIPIFGALIGTIPGIFIIFMVDPMKAIYFLILIIVIQQLEGNLIYPMVVGNSIGLSAIWVLFAITVGGSTFGIVGILIGIPLFGVIYTVFGSVVNRRLKDKNIQVRINEEINIEKDLKKEEEIKKEEGTK